MAKRRRIVTPTDADLTRFEEEFRSTPSRPQPGAGLAPIAQVAAEAAEGASAEAATTREARARDAADAERFREAQAGGRVMADLPLDAIDADAMVRDRMVMDQGEMDELRRSILEHGLRLPIEVFARADGGYGLISGYRRLKALRSIRNDLGLKGHDTIRAVIRDPDEIGGAIVAMVEENEIRSALSHYERGRIAVIAAEEGSYVNTEEAVAALFSNASKAKRSKIRSFALIHEELGDLLDHAEKMTERDGLRLAGMLRQNGEAELRAALAEGPAETFEAEWAMIEPVLRAHERRAAGQAEAPQAGTRPGRGGAPRKAGRPSAQGPADATDHLSNGIRLDRRRVRGGVAITITGAHLDEALLDSLMAELRFMLDKP
ncbi:ParB-like nuclease [Oceaniovalibus guishaninsula JLT2003]|uniref:ParB-like nuclease n=1 Tax=Oceaniovalibus guishaninsula JLT2003 TaxID=1231392 RepID=K2HJ90_9RHOB|nr:ParB N-terminal domain-containing protein [Oceaniovalibus guishaninsula]EKE43069.1 ParB-like nuclease [Oceaniovalibus guishaninsula JLT2003]